MLKAILDARRRAKHDKNWKVADQIRNELSTLGLKLRDNKDGTIVVEKDGIILECS